jgi:hypothetical protein
MQQTSIHKPQTLNLDKHPKNLTETESFYLLNFQNWVTKNTKKTGNLSKGNQFPANRPACDMEVPAGENYAVGTYYSILTNETYGFIYNSNGVHFLSRINSVGECQIVYYGPCLPLSADPKRAITEFRCWMKYDRTCKNRDGKELYFVTGEFEGCIDVEASIATNNFTTPFFDRCSSGCEFTQMCVPDPSGCLSSQYVSILSNPGEEKLTNLLMNKGFQFRYRYVYYDGRGSNWSSSSTYIYQEKGGFNDTQPDYGRSIKLRIPVGNALVEKIEIAVSENNSNTWRKIAVIDKYKKYNTSQEKWYQRGLAELPNYSDSDCSFDYLFYNDSIGETVDPSEINRNYNPHPRNAQGLFPFSLKSGNNTNALAYYNYEKGNCPVDSIQANKFKITTDGAPLQGGIRGLKSGGTYNFGFVLKGDCGRFSFVYGNQVINMPREQDPTTGYYRSFFYDATGMVLPDWVTSISIVRTENLNGFELQWIVDSFERVNGNIILTIQSLNQYNEDHIFKANTVYQFLEGDVIEFIRNGSAQTGLIFDSATYGVLSYPILSPTADESLSSLIEFPADFFNQIIIKDDGRLSGLIAGATIEFQRPKKVTDNLPYYEVCANIPVVNGRLVSERGQFSTFDTYSISRLIGSTYVRFQHHSPNDFWPTIVGSKGVSDIGRVHVVNQYEDEKRYGRNITINSPTEFNRFGDFEKTLPASEQGDIIAVGIWDNFVGLAIGEHDNFLFKIGDDFARVGSDGVLRAAPVDSLISDPEPKVSGKFGCQYDHIGSVLFADGWVNWVDVNRHAYVKHDFSSAKDVSVGKTQLYFRVRCQELETHNRNATNDLDKFRFSTGYNKGDETVMITLKKLRDSGVNNSYKSFQLPNDTLIFHPASDEWLGYASFTPEAYSYYNLFDGDGCSFIAYLNGIPYYHPVTSDKYNEFFGIQVDQFVGITINKFPEKIKIALAGEIQSEMMWFSPEVTTDKEGFLSEIPPKRVVKDGRKWNFSFLFDKNSKGGLFNNDSTVMSPDTRGYYINFILSRDNTIDLKYGTIDPSKRTKYNEMDMVICKFALAEQSGMTENL